MLDKKQKKGSSIIFTAFILNSLKTYISQILEEKNDLLYKFNKT